jgi:23S rRNA pseudouridine1911/1915/1917 synthase
MVMATKPILDILYEDQYMIAVNKQAGILSIPDRFNPDLSNIVTMLKKSIPDVIPVHRLDKFTSGINLYAKDSETHRRLSMAFENRTIEKYYTAIVDGKPNPESGRIDVPLTESQVTRGKMIIHKRGKESVTDYKIIASYGDYSHLYIRLHTGRMHQIRVHLQYLGNPLIVDALYGARDAFFISEIKKRKFNIGKFEEEKPILTRQPLHAQDLVLSHPYTEEKIQIHAPMPKDMDALLKQMSKWLH